MKIERVIVLCSVQLILNLSTHRLRKYFQSKPTRYTSIASIKHHVTTPHYSSPHKPIIINYNLIYKQVHDDNPRANLKIYHSIHHHTRRWRIPSSHFLRGYRPLRANRPQRVNVSSAALSVLQYVERDYRRDALV